MKKVLKNKLIIVLLFLIVVSLLYLFSFRQDASAVFSNKNKTTSNVVSGNVNATSTVSNVSKIKPQDETKLFKYIEITEGCDYSFRNGCVNVRSGPGINYKVVSRLRNGTVLKVDSVKTVNGEDWYKISFDEWLRYPERMNGGWYVSVKVSNLFFDEGTVMLNKKIFIPNSKHIIISLSEQTLYAYDGDNLFMKEKVSTGVKETETPTGKFVIYKKTPSRYMQGPIPGSTEKEYDTPGVPWDLYFTKDGAVIHGAFWHNNFGKVFSNGCVNLPPEKAKELYAWADVGIPVVVKD